MFYYIAFTYSHQLHLYVQVWGHSVKFSKCILIINILIQAISSWHLYSLDFGILLDNLPLHKVERITIFHSTIVQEMIYTSNHMAVRVIWDKSPKVI